MNGTQMSHVEDVLAQVSSWPSANKLTLATRILQSLHSQEDVNRMPRLTNISDVVGHLGGNGAPPSDEECAKIIEEERLRKYGI